MTVEHDQAGFSSYKIGSGDLRGDTMGSQFFIKCFRQPILNWAPKCLQPMLAVVCPLTKRKVDNSRSASADDVCNKIRVQGFSSDQGKAMITSSRNVLDEEPRPTSIGQIVSKQEIRITCYGRSSRTIARTLGQTYKDGRMMNSLKYHGVWDNDSGSATVKVNTRVQAAWQNRYMFYSVLADKKAPFNTRLCFISMVCNILLSGMEPFVFSDVELDRMTAFMCGMSRALLSGKAHSDIGGKHASWSNVQVLKTCGLLPVDVELAVRSPEWVRNIVCEPETMGALLPVWFGKCVFDSIEPCQLPWNIQLAKDLVFAARIEDWDHISEQVRRDPITLFPFHKSYMLDFDHEYPRALLLDQLQRVFASVDKVDPNMPGDIHVCDICDEQGNICGCQAPSLAMLRHHQGLSSQKGHSTRSFINICIVPNQCCVCMSVFSDSATAQPHLANAFARGRCRADAGYKKCVVCLLSLCLLFPDSTPKRAVCDYAVMIRMDDLQRHVRTHLWQHMDVLKHEMILTRETEQTGNKVEGGGSCDQVVRVDSPPAATSSHGPLRVAGVGVENQAGCQHGAANKDKGDDIFISVKCSNNQRRGGQGEEVKRSQSAQVTRQQFSEDQDVDRSLLWSWMVPVAVCSTAVQDGKKYNQTKKAVKANGPTSLGMHSKGILSGRLEAIHTKAGTMEEGQDKVLLVEAGSHLQTFLKDLASSGPKKVGTFIRYFQIKTIQDPPKAIVLFQISTISRLPAEVERTLHYVMEILEASLLEESEPATPMEGTQQAEIAKLKQELVRGRMILNARQPATIRFMTTRSRKWVHLFLMILTLISPSIRMIG